MDESLLDMYKLLRQDPVIDYLALARNRDAQMVDVLLVGSPSDPHALRWARDYPSATYALNREVTPWEYQQDHYRVTVITPDGRYVAHYDRTLA